MIVHAHGLEKLIMSSLHSQNSYIFNPIPIKIPMTFFIEIDKSLKICIEPQKLPKIQKNLEQNWRHNAT
jgi:hypothetical protein